MRGFVHTVCRAGGRVVLPVPRPSSTTFYVPLPGVLHSQKNLLPSEAAPSLTVWTVSQGSKVCLPHGASADTQRESPVTGEGWGRMEQGMGLPPGLCHSALEWAPFRQIP